MAGILDKFRLDGRLALITGSSGGIGGAIAISGNASTTLLTIGADTISLNGVNFSTVTAADFVFWVSPAGFFGARCDLSSLSSHRAISFRADALSASL